MRFDMTALKSQIFIIAALFMYVCLFRFFFFCFKSIVLFVLIATNKVVIHYCRSYIFFPCRSLCDVNSFVAQMWINLSSFCLSILTGCFVSFAFSYCLHWSLINVIVHAIHTDGLKFIYDTIQWDVESIHRATNDPNTKPNNTNRIINIQNGSNSSQIITIWHGQIISPHILFFFKFEIHPNTTESFDCR